jgi:hypothetical protein
MIARLVRSHKRRVIQSHSVAPLAHHMPQNHMLRRDQNLQTCGGLDDKLRMGNGFLDGYVRSKMFAVVRTQ